MPVQTQLFPDSPPEGGAARAGTDGASAGGDGAAGRTAPVWLQRMSLCVLVLFCVYLGVLVTALPWWPRIWDENLFFLTHPALSRFLHRGEVRGAISGLGLLDIWIGISEAIHYRDHRAGR